MLEQDAVPAFLVENGLLAREELLRGSFEVRDASRRNRNFVVVGEKTSLLVKQGIGEERRRSLAREADVYCHAIQLAALSEVRAFMPVLHRYDVEQATLVLDYVAKPNLANHVRRLGRVPKSWMRWLAQFLATLHRSSSGPAESGDLSRLRDHRVPFGLRFDEPDLNLLYMCSDASISLVSILQGCPELSEHLAQLRSIWQPGCLVHGDLRWDNVIVFPGEARRSADPPLRIVDWELAAVGDPCWDIGAVFAAFLGIWLETAPIAGSDPEAYLSLARFPLARTRPALATFWYAYAERMGLVEHDRREWMLRAVRYSAARVVQTAFEWMQTATSPSPHAVLMLQLADNILCRPHDAAIELLGLGEAHPAA